jgi:hypothetical protein
MAKQAQNDFYRDFDELVMDIAVALNEEAHDLHAAGADVIQLDEPWLRTNPEAARRYAVKAINRALDNITVPTIVHVCFGYAAIVPGSSKPGGYPFLTELADCCATQISVEAAQPRLDLGILKELSAKTIVLGVLDLGDPEIEPASVIADRIRNGLKEVAAGAAGGRARLRHEIHAARNRLRETEGDVRGGDAGPRGARIKAMRRTRRMSGGVLHGDATLGPHSRNKAGGERWRSAGPLPTEWRL